MTDCNASHHDSCVPPCRDRFHVYVRAGACIQAARCSCIFTLLCVVFNAIEARLMTVSCRAHSNVDVSGVQPFSIAELPHLAHSEPIPLRQCMANTRANAGPSSTQGMPDCCTRCNAMIDHRCTFGSLRPGSRKAAVGLRRARRTHQQALHSLACRNKRAARRWVLTLPLVFRPAAPRLGANAFFKCPPRITKSPSAAAPASAAPAPSPSPAATGGGGAAAAAPLPSLVGSLISLRSCFSHCLCACLT
jgi:hypothetical protein